MLGEILAGLQGVIRNNRTRRYGKWNPKLRGATKRKAIARTAASP
jgi:hypothetical protein